jgi:glycosyltransferase involved in cell wall biosynthesis
VTQTATAVIPTLGRLSLNPAVRSLLDQTRPVWKVILVADTDEPVTLPRDDRITSLQNLLHRGPCRCRQLGIDAAHGSVIALLDDGEWYRAKLERQLQVVDDESARIVLHSAESAVRR